MRPTKCDAIAESRQRNIEIAEIVGIGQIRAKRSTLPHSDGVEIRDNTSSKQ
jgi:hypothetical protein